MPYHWEHHPEPVDGCFGCKVLGLQMNTGDANSQRVRPQREFNRELNAYENARANGIQPGGTSMAKIRAAEKASEILGRPYNANTMPAAERITPGVASVMKEIGQ